MQKGLNNQSIQQTNRSLVLEMIIEKGVATRKDLVEQTGLHKPTITNIVNELREMDVIEECEVPRQEGQRKINGFTIKTTKVLVLSARWVRTFFEVTLYTLSRKFIAREYCTISTSDDIDLTCEKILATINRLVDRHMATHILGMCIGVPGPYLKGNKNEALVAGYKKLQEIDIQRYFAGKFSFPVITEQDAHLSAFAEWKNMSMNARSKCSCMLALQSIGIGIGSGVILDGKIVEGAFGIAGEIGQMGIMYSGTKNTNGARGVLENFASSESVKNYVQLRLFEFPDSILTSESSYKEILDAYENHDMLAEWAFDTLAWMLAYGLMNTVFVINPSEIIIGPDYPKSQRFIDKIRSALDEMIDGRISRRINVRYSEIAGDPTLEGGFYFVVDHFMHNHLLFDRIKEIVNSN